MAKTLWPIIEEANRRVAWKNSQTFKGDCNCVLESLLAGLPLDYLDAAIDRQGFPPDKRYRQAAMLLQEIARGRRAERIGARDKKKRVSFQYIIAECIERASPEIEVDCNSLLESLMAETSLGEVVGAVNQQGFQAAHEYGRAATVLQEIARQRRRLRSKEGDGGVGLGDQK